MRHPPSPGPTALALSLVVAIAPIAASGQTDPIDVLIVVAHPDDDAMFSGTIYKLTHTLGANVDLALITDGSGGYSYAHFSEAIYGLELTNETVARQYLPAIRKRELMAGGRIVGIRNYFFFDEYDHGPTESIDTVLTHVWDAADVRTRLEHLMTRVAYDYVLVHLPIPNFHGHHKAATVLALEAAQNVSADHRPVVLGSFFGSKADTDTAPLTFTEHPGYPITRVRADLGPFAFDMEQTVDPRGRLNYRIISNWVIAEHKTQGVMQTLMNAGDVERFWYFAVNDPSKVTATREMFRRLGEP